jgi:hypothetical protein
VTANAERLQVRQGKRIAAIRNPDDVVNLKLLARTAGHALLPVTLPG